MVSVTYGKRIYGKSIMANVTNSRRRAYQYNEDNFWFQFLISNKLLSIMVANKHENKVKPSIRPYNSLDSSRIFPNFLNRGLWEL